MDGPVAAAVTNGSIKSPGAAATSFALDPSTVVDYLRNLLKVNLGAADEDLESSGSLLSPRSRPETIQQCTRFAGESQIALYITQNAEDEEPVDGEDGVDGFVPPRRYTYTLSSDLSPSSSWVGCIVILKARPQPLDPSIPLTSQISTVNLPGIASISESAEVLHNVIHLALGPYFDVATREKGSTKRTFGKEDGRTGIGGTKRRFAELGTSLQHLQQDVDIPILQLALHPIIQSAIDEAERRNMPASIDFIPRSHLEDATFLNGLQSTVNGWIKSIQGITRTDRDPASGTASQEINFWLSMETRLQEIETQLGGDGVRLTVDTLKHAKRFAATTSFSTDTDLKEATERVHRFNQLMRDFPLDELLSATSLQKIEFSIDIIFAHLNKKMRITPYPVKRALALVENISQVLDTQMHKILNGNSLMQLEFDEFQSYYRAADSIFRAWDYGFKDFTNTAREMVRKRNEKFIPLKINSRHAKTQERLKYVASFRNNHNELQRTIVNVLGPGPSLKESNDAINGTSGIIIEEIGGVNAVEEVAKAYDELKNTAGDVLDVSEEGTQRWDLAEARYGERTSRVENSIISRLRDRLATAKTANEMFRVFSKFNALFVRPKIRSAISEYQTQLIDSVKNDISALHERFKRQYGHSEAHAMAQLRDLPPVSGAIMWASEIERQLDQYMERVENILGSDWTVHIEGQKLYQESVMFRKKLDTRPIFDSWLADVNRRNLSISGRLFTISRNRAAGNAFELGVNFDPQVITLFKEVRNLLWRNYQVPHAVNNVSKEAKRVYPYAVSLMESVRAYAQTARNIIAMGDDVAILLSGYQNDVQLLISRGIPLKWDSFVHAYEVNIRPAQAGGELALGRTTESKHVQYVRDFASAVGLLQSKTATLTAIHASIAEVMKELEVCAYTFDAFSGHLDAIQKAVDTLSLESYANLDYWVGRMNSQIEEVLLRRLTKAIQEWIAFFNQAGEDDRKEDPALAMSVPYFDQLVHEITMRNQVIYLEPPLEYARASWLAQLHNWLAVICDLPKVKASRYEMRIDSGKDAQDAKFSDLPAQCADALVSVYATVEQKVLQIAAYVEEWLRFQSLWDLQSEQVYDTLGDNLAVWLQLLQEIRKTRGTFDTSDVSRSFGHVTIDYEQVQTKVNAKYDQWQHDIQLKFASRLNTRMLEVYEELQSARKQLETSSLEASSTKQAVAFITIVTQCKRKVKTWGPEVETFKQGQTMLSRQRYQFPNDWLYVDQIDHEWTTLNEILERKAKVVADQSDALRSKIQAQDTFIQRQIEEIASEWNDEKPISGNIPPKEASELLEKFDKKLSALQEESAMVEKAKEALDLPAGPENSLNALFQEVQDFKSVWDNISTIWSRLHEERDHLWASIQPRKLRQFLDELVKSMRSMPSRIRQYAAFEHIQNVLKGYIKINPLLADLRSEAIQERHWVKIFKELKPNKRYLPSSLTLGDVWDLRLDINEAVIRDVLTQAQGELALEEFIKQVRETWQNYSLDLVNYQNKCRLIRGWDDLFAKCSENLNSLQAMRHSPYYRQFEEEASSWEDKLNRVHVLFDVWIDVQRQWVYLEGVFTGNADIAHLLPVESNRFQNINNEFMAVMKRVSRNPFVMEVLGIQNVQKSLERLAELLNKIQKALGEYLERERVSFPRFYFVGDEDLLEIIGNSNDTLRIAKHLRKMFAGLAGLTTDEDRNILGFTSKEGEQVPLKKQVSLIKTPKVNEWLAALELNMKTTLADLLVEAVQEFSQILAEDTIDQERFDTYIDIYPAQIVVLATQVCWTNAVEQALREGGSSLPSLFDRQVAILQLLAGTVLGDLEPIKRKKCEHLITEFVHQRDVIGKLQKFGADSPTNYLWLLQMRYAYTPDAEPLKRLQIKMANASLDYGFEYLGLPERLVRTPLTDRCFLTLTQALCQRLGGSPYGPAGTGKTESVKALGVQLGRFTLVFCCDDTFDFQAMGRIFLGICQVGAWGCFDEFNRLEERILSAVSQQVQNIQVGLRKGAVDEKAQIELIGRSLRVNGNTGIFITMNPGYAGRSNLPDNLKKLFRSVAMSKPDKELIAEVMLYSQGFSQAKELSRQTVPFFDQCGARLSKQAHYDFGLRALKSVLVSSGGLKRARIAGGSLDAAEEAVMEPQIIVQSLRETIAPKLIRQDLDVMRQIESESFPDVEYVPASLDALKKAIHEVAAESKLVVSDAWMTKVLQLYQIQGLHHGVMMVGSSGSGKSRAWRVLLQALQRVEGIEGVSHLIDPKVMSKEALYGTLDSTTREWTDGLFTSILRKIVDNLRGEDSKRHWIVFDGDVDPEWVENLNSVLDDNKLLTLPNGERLNLPSNVRIMFEVETLKYATLATVSRCGMVWFSDDTVTTDMMVTNYLGELREKVFDDIEDDTAPRQQGEDNFKVQSQVAVLLQQQLLKDGFLDKALEHAQRYHHIMEFTEIRALNTLFSLLSKTCRSLIEYNVHHSDFMLDDEQIESYVSKKVLLALTWSFTGDCPLTERKAFGDYIASLTSLDLPVLGDTTSLIDFDVGLPRADWKQWQSQVPTIEVNTHSVTQNDVVIPTVDTVRHEDVLYSWLSEHKPLLLCGPPGSGKTMTLFSALRKLPNMEVVGLNFSSATTPDLLIKTFDQHCEYRKTVNGVVLAPSQIGRWLVVFCDEINLPAPDKYGTQRAISFLRQLVEHNGFWRTSDKTWVTLDRIQFVGACNPPTDVGRTPLGLRFLRHAPLLMVDYPGELSLQQIYGTFNNAVLKIISSLRGYSEPLTKAMVQVYSESQKRFTPDIQPHYVYSPRELTRWVRGIYEALKPLESLPVEGLVRIWAHEAQRLFSDRLIGEDERKWTEDCIHRVALEHFPTIDEEKALGGPILFSNWLSKNYVPVDREQLRDFVKARLRTFCEEEVDTPLILFNDVLDHVLRIDRVFRQPQGHLILIGVSGSGKTTLSRFVAWMNGLKVYQIKVHGKYSSEDFDEDLRNVLRRCGCKGEKICFIMDESNVLDSGFLEQMNTLLANAEVPGLFEGDEFQTLMTSCREGAQRQGLLLDSQEELYSWFRQQIIKNLHVVFTMNPPEEGLSSKAATSPALFNRCVLNWFGDWSDQAFFQVGSELTQSVDLDRPNFKSPDTLPIAYRDLNLPATYRDAVVNAMVYIHYSLGRFNGRLLKQQGKKTFLTPRHFLDFVEQYVKLFNEKREDLEEQQRHLNVGLDKLRETFDKVRDLKVSLAEKEVQLKRKGEEQSAKMRKIVADNNEADKQKAAAEEIEKHLIHQTAEMNKRKQIVDIELAEAMPAVEEAAKSVGNIKKQQLTEVRSMANPPAGVKLALEAVCNLIGEKVHSWKEIAAAVRKEDFIARIVRFDNDRDMTPRLRVQMQKDFLSNSEFTYERVNRASKACGPLVQWVEAQVRYSEILDKVGPLREELQQLEEEQIQTAAEKQAIQNKRKSIEDSIAALSVEYEQLVGESTALKKEMEGVQAKVERSERLLASLGSERTRWEESSKSFEAQIDTLIGDVLVAAAFLAYGGFYDQQYRKAMAEDWLHQLSLSGIRYKPVNPVTEYLSTADERLTWQEHSLPVDDLCTENAIILKRFNRYPLIIDPSGRVTEFLQNECKGRRLTVTSFLDASFTKQLESSLRFGNPILIQDAEYLDPILNHVLNKEYQKTGGRVLIQLGKQEIDFSPSFKLYLSTRDPSATFAPDICSRTTFVNFTVTQSSLQTQSLNEVLKSEQPKVDERRSNLIKMQGEFSVHLRQLEKRLLAALNESQGNILDDDNVIRTLETLKKEAAEITAKVSETEGIMTEVEDITKKYQVIARSCSAIFAVLEQLHHLNHFYQFSLQFFTDIFEHVLRVAKQISETNDSARIDFIIKELFINTYRRTSLALLQKDRVTLAMLLAQAAPFKVDKTLIDSVLDPDLEGIDTSTETDRREEAFQLVRKHRDLKDYIADLPGPQLEAFFIEEPAEGQVPQFWPSDMNPLDQQLRSLILTKLLRYDRFVPQVERFVAQAFGRGILDVTDDLAGIVKQVGPNTPIALSSSPGFDASYKVDSLVEGSRATCTNIAMGSNEGLASADKAVSTAAATGSWVLVKNVHLAPAWLQSLEKRIDSLKPHPDFRLFLSMETSPKIPVNLLRASRVLMYEQPAGIRANMKDSFGGVPMRAAKQPVERARVYLLLSFLHAVVQERIRFAPNLGWKGFWEFNDSDYECCAVIIDTWIEAVAGDRTNIRPEAIPWDMIRALITEMYGGKIDDEGDFNILRDLVNHFMTPVAFEEGYEIVKDGPSGLALPSGTQWKDFMEWIKRLPEREPPTYLGLPANAEKLLLVGQAKGMISDLRLISNMLDEGEQLMAEVE